MSYEQIYYLLAIGASKKVGWLPEVIFTQWQVETGHFTSNNFIKNNNIAGQTWTSNLPLSERGSARPKSEGGYYIKYDNPIDGYVNFILNNPRYNKVKTFNTPKDQFREIAYAGWAGNTQNDYENYYNLLYAVYQSNLKKGLFIADKPALPGIIKLGSQGELVRLIQDKLGIKVDGIFGSLTEKAVKEFQRNNGLAVDGIVGQNTWSKMF
jgi:murein L,D-transpeptidase YcbB/YkuD